MPKLNLERFLGNGVVAKQVGAWRETILILEDDSAWSKRQPILGLQRSVVNSAVVVRMHKVVGGEWKEIAGEVQVSKALKRGGPRNGRLEAALKLLKKIDEPRDDLIVVAGASYGNSAVFVRELVGQGLDFAVEIWPSKRVKYAGDTGRIKLNKVRASDLLADAEWSSAQIIPPGRRSSVRYSVANLPEVRLLEAKTGRLFAAQTGGIEELHPGTIIAITSVQDASLEELLNYVGWARWIRPLVRRRERSFQKLPSRSDGNGAGKSGYGLALRHRSNITLARLQDESSEDSEFVCFGDGPRRVQFGEEKVLNLVELFAGAGGMGLGFLMAEHRQRSFRLVFSGEIHPIYVQTLKSNHDYLVRMRKVKRTKLVPESIQAVNLDGRNTFDQVDLKVGESGGVDVLIGGPPCQGFSSANRNSWSSNNPQNRFVNVFMRYVEKLKPRVFLMENVQGIVWTAKNGKADVQPSFADHILKRMKSAGYLVFPKLLDAVWYGVPQFRTRFFVLGIHRDAGYSTEDFGTWGPFPAPTQGPAVAGRPFITVREAIGDLPAIGNGHKMDEMDYCERTIDAANWFLKLMRSDAPKKKILDHVSSRHADYVIERYKRIPPGGNWQDIAEMMSNYAQLERTHSNIYRRLEWDEPSITIGHYRKSMVVHPDQHRGLSLREACRLQAFPDWFRFAGTADGQPGGLMHKQQQLANAVSPLLSKAIAEFILEL